MKGFLPIKSGIPEKMMNVRQVESCGSNAEHGSYSGLSVQTRLSRCAIIAGAALLIASLLLLPTCVRGDMIVRDYRPVRHDRFYSGSDKSFVGAAFNFSGVGISSSGHWATLVADNGFLSAFHRHPAVGETVTFWATNDHTGPGFTYTVTGGKRVGRTDIWVGWFEKPVDISISRYPVLVLRAIKSYIGLRLFNYGMIHRVGQNVLDGLAWFKYGGSTELSLLYDYDNNDDPSVGGDETWLMGGDSGAPSFAVFNSELALIGIHCAITSRTANSIDSFVPVYFDEINKVLARRGQSLTRVLSR
jgi:hypothetical protein